MANPRYFEYALMVEEFGSFKRAALELHVSQPALSKGIAALEAEYGVVLFDRVSRPLRPTPAGQIVLEEGRRLLEGDKALKSRLLQMRGMINHQVRIAFGPYAGKVYGAKFTTAFHAKFPRSELHLQTCSWDQLPRLLRNRQIDLFAGDISSESLRQEFDILPLPPDPVCYVCSPAHALAGHRRLKVPEITRFPLILGSTPPWAKAWLKNYMLNFDSRESPATIRVDDFRMIRDVLLENPNLGTLGAGSCFIEEIRQGILTAIEIESAPSFQAGIVTGKPGPHLPILGELTGLFYQLTG